MKSNVEIIQDTIEQVVNQKKIDMWDEYFSQDYIARGAPFVGMGFSAESSGNKHTINFIAPGSPVEGKILGGTSCFGKRMNTSAGLRLRK